MRTLILSDLHVGPDGNLAIFAGHEALPTLLESLLAEPEPLHVVVNGDGFDFLMNEDPLELREETARLQARALVGGRDGQAFFGALRGVIKARGRVTIRSGNHDPELALEAVQDVIREALGATARDAPVAFDGSASMKINVAGARVAVAHGELNDHFNRFDRSRVVADDGFVYPPGSVLVKEFLNPAKHDGLRFTDLLKPDVEGALVATLAVQPHRASGLIDSEFVDIVRRCIARRRGDLYDLVDPESQRARPRSLAHLDFDDLQVLLELIERRGDEALVRGVASRIKVEAKARLLRAGLWLTSAAHRCVVGEKGAAYFSYEPNEGDWQEAANYAGPGVDAVVLGHTHAARCGSRDGVTLVNTGTWIPLMGLPRPGGPATAWRRLLEDLLEDPGLEGCAQHRLLRQFHGALISDDEKGAWIELLAVDVRGTVVDQRKRLLVACATAKRRSLVVASPVDGLTAAGKTVEPSTGFSDIEHRIARLEAEVDRWGRRDVRRPGVVLTSARHLQLLATATNELLKEARGAHTANSSLEALRLLVQAEATWEVYRVIDGQRRGFNGQRLEWAESIVFDGYETVLGRASRSGLSPEDDRIRYPLVYLQPYLSPVISRRGASLISPGLMGLPATIPFPVVMAPPDHLACPWYLTLLLHEVGHEFDRDLELTNALRDVLDGPRADSWRRWLAEIVADVVGLYLAGPRFLDCMRCVVEPMLGLGGGWSHDAVHPPVLLRFRLLELVLRSEGLASASGGALARQIAEHTLAKRYAADLDQVIVAVLRTPLEVVRGATLRKLLPGLDTAIDRWRGLPGRVWAPGDDHLAANARFEQEATALEPLQWQMGEHYRRFLKHHVPRLAPTYADPKTLFKVPPLALLTGYDEAVFVAATNGQLASRMAEAFELRKRRKWRRLELFFLDDASLHGLATEERPAKKLIAERDTAIGELSAELGRWTEDWAMYVFREPYQFLSLWSRTVDGKEERRVHSSANIWGLDIRHAPSTDYLDAGVDTPPEVDRYFEGLEHLRRRATPIL